MFVYAAFGLSIRSDVRVPGLHESSDASSSGATSAEIPLTVRVEARRGEATSSAFDVDIAPDVVRFDHVEIGRVTIRDGRTIVVEPHARADERALALFVAGPALAVALHQRGRLVLHATAVAIGDRALAILGEKGAGKSTLAAALTRRGHRLLSDDLVVVDERGGAPLVLPGTATLRIQPEAARALGVDPATLALLHPDSEKRAWPGSADGRRVDATPLAALLVASRGPGPALEPLDGSAALLELVRHTYGARFDFMQRSGGSARHFAQVAALVRAVRSFRLARGDELARLPETAERVEALVA